MSDTPETDAKVSGHIGFYSCATVPAELCRRMERERDEARADLEFRRGLDGARTAFVVEARRERDEARQQYDDLATEHVLAVNKLAEERDAARELAQQMSESNQVLMADVRFYRNAWEQRREAAK